MSLKERIQAEMAAEKLSLKERIQREMAAETTQPEPTIQPTKQPIANDWGTRSHPSDLYTTPEQTKRLGTNIGQAGIGGVQSVMDTAGMMGLGKVPEIEGGQIVGGGVRRLPDMADDPESRAARTFAEWATPLPLTKLSKADPLIGAAAAGGEYLADEVGEVVGGLGASVAALLRGKSAFNPTAEESARKFVELYAEDSAKALENLRAADERGEVGTLAQLTRDPNLYNLEATAKKGSKLKRELDAVTQGRYDRLSENLDEQLGSPVPYRVQEQLATTAADKVNTLQKNIDEAGQSELRASLTDIESQLPKAKEQLKQAESQLSDRHSKLATSTPPSVASKGLEGAITKKEKLFREAKEKPAWDKFSKGQKLDVNEIIAAPMAAIDDMNPSEVKILTNKFGNELAIMRGWSDKANKGLVEPDEVHTVISQIKAINAADDAQTNANRLLGKVGRALEESLITLGDRANYDKAVALTKEKHDRFRSGRLGKERAAKEPETFGKRLLDTDEGGAVVGDLLLGTKSPTTIKKTQDYLKSIVSRDGVDQKFLNKYDELLTRFPELKADLTAAKKAQDAVASAQEKVSKLPQAIERESKLATLKQEEKTAGLTKALAAKQINTLKSNPEKFIDDSLVNRSAKDLTKVNEQLADVEGGQELLKQAIKDRILKKLVKKPDGEVSIPATSVGEFHSMKRNLIDAGILSKDEVIDIERTLDDAKFTERFTARAAEQKASKASQIIDDVFASGLSIQVLNMMPTAQHQLMLANTVKRAIKTMLSQDTYDPKALAALGEIMTNPKVLLEDIIKEGLTTEQQITQYLSRIGRSVTQSITSDEQEID